MTLSDETSIIRAHRDATIDDIIRVIHTKNSGVDEAEVRRAYDFAVRAFS